MIRVCYCCKTKLGEIEPFEDKRVTHGLCDACHQKEIAEVRRLSNQKAQHIVGPENGNSQRNP